MDQRQEVGADLGLGERVPDQRGEGSLYPKPKMRATSIKNP